MDEIKEEIHQIIDAINNPAILDNMYLLIAEYAERYGQVRMSEAS